MMQASKVTAALERIAKMRRMTQALVDAVLDDGSIEIVDIGKTRPILAYRWNPGRPEAGEG